MKNNLPKRKPTRLNGYDYSTPGAYFITLCTKGRKKILSQIVGTGLPDGPQNILTKYGISAEKYILEMSKRYDGFSVERYVIMPNHIHLLIHITLEKNGPSKSPVPTNSKISKFVGTLKRFTNKEFSQQLWQYRSHDHIIRGEKDYEKIAEYIDSNVLRWEKDCFYND